MTVRRALSLIRKAATYSPALRCSTIGVPGLNFSVRDGKRWDPGAKATRIFLWDIDRKEERTDGRRKKRAVQKSGLRKEQACGTNNVYACTPTEHEVRGTQAKLTGY